MRVDNLHGTAQLEAAAAAAVSTDRGLDIGARLASSELKLSIVIPCYNEVDSIDPLYERLKASMNAFAPNHEIIFVDDGSNDGTKRKLNLLFQADKSVTVILFRRNYGKAAALSAGFGRTTGDLVLMMDADLQDQPEEFPVLVDKLEEGYDLVTGWKRRRHDPLGKTLPSKLFNKVVGHYFRLNLHDFNCGYKLMRGEVARSLTLYGDFHRFIPVLAAEQGYLVAEVPVEHAARQFGKSKYGFKRLFTGFLDFASTILLTRFLNKPLQFFGGFGGMLLISGFGIGGWLLFETLIGNGGHIRPLWIVMALLVLSGIQVITTGLLAELSVRFNHFRLGADELFPARVLWHVRETEPEDRRTIESIGAI